MKLLLDEMYDPAVAEQLRQRGHDIVAIVEGLTLRSATDDVVFSMAQLESRVIVTENVGDFRPLVADFVERGNQHAGLIYTTNRQFPRNHPRTVGRLVAALKALLTSNRSMIDTETWLDT